MIVHDDLGEWEPASPAEHLLFFALLTPGLALWAWLIWMVVR